MDFAYEVKTERGVEEAVVAVQAALA